MALDGPYTLDDLIAMTGGRKKRAARVPPVLTLERRSRTLRLIGIDPGTRYVGWGVIERSTDGALKLLECGCIAPGVNLPLKDRLKTIFSDLEEILKRTKPDAAALEETFAGVNMKSAIAMGEGRGIALLCLARANLEVLELAPRSIKRAVTGSGAAGKAHVASLVCAQLGLKKTPEPEDITDALAAAIALARRTA
ncbi:MAG TPA: crossover junction endodeoxyribonuclease RuvC [Planctomycetota bacterium]|nr:crossover junction endodeoxyribonuclease RuvC [Planctomycetota bacterium]